MIHYHDTSRPAPSRERARCGRAIPRQPGYCCAELLDITTDGHGRHVEACPACDWGWRRTRPLYEVAEEEPEQPTEWEMRTDPKLVEGRKAAIRRALRAFYKANGRGPTFREMGHEGGGGKVPGVPDGTTVRRLFGSVAIAFQEAGVPRNPRGHWPERVDRGRGMVMRRVVP